MSSAPGQSMSITRSNIWYNDGSVVLQSENTQFRVHWSILSQHSPFFRDLERLPQPPNQPTADGCPIVELSDSAENVEYLLKALYDPHFLGQTTLTLAAVGALIQLGRKYDFQTLCESAVERIKFENPTTLEEYDALFAFASNGARTYTPTRITYCYGFAFAMLTLVRENNILSALPVAYYRASLFSPRIQLDGIQKKDSDVDGTLVSLAPLELGLCLTGRERLLCQQYKQEYALGFFVASQPPRCIAPAKCGAVRKHTFDLWMDKNSVNPLYNFRSNSDWIKYFCAACYEHASKANAAGRKKSWKELPAIFDLPPWDQLKNNGV
ncbi:BTB domain-containing protein [Mycena sanguinolenta]|uniref:BTB domain-containing protein n=1 Tax=Mycena sanguinolenta TaxID=230812 RepID=A0A8H7CX19_9AGAR|nr:BTB domain-containing protein [Mycena sanguinolenta]